jgi:hypothetical protein
MIFLWNVTKEPFDYTYGGLNYRIEAGKRKQVSEAEGNHALNAIGSRGLKRLVFDDDGKSINEEQIEKDALERSREFKIRQINNYNFQNQERKASGKSYNPPTAEVRRYAVELGIALLQGYDMATGEREVIAKLSKENDEKDKKLEEQGAAISNLTDIVSKLSQQIEGGFVKSKDVVKSAMVVCEKCGEEVLASKLDSHMRFKHKEGS